MIRLCSCGFGTDDDDWMTCHLIGYPEHNERDLEPYLGRKLPACPDLERLDASGHCFTAA